jgi:plasmid stabilization system protein ParE
LSYFFLPAAEAEHLESVAFYETRRAGLGASYLASFETAMEHVVEAPRRYRIERNPDIRRIGLERFPFHVVFRETQNGVQVLAVAHNRRHPSY